MTLDTAFLWRRFGERADTLGAAVRHVSDERVAGGARPGRAWRRLPARGG